MVDFGYHNFIKATCTKMYNCLLYYGETYFVDVANMCKLQGVLYAPVYEKSKTNKNLPKGKPLYLSFPLNGVFDVDFSNYSYEPWDIM